VSTRLLFLHQVHAASATHEAQCADERTRLVEVLLAAHNGGVSVTLELGPNDVVVLRLCRSKGLSGYRQRQRAAVAFHSPLVGLSCHTQEKFIQHANEVFDLGAKETQYGTDPDFDARVFGRDRVAIRLLQTARSRPARTRKSHPATGWLFL
jgi:hypothetical protein